VLGRKKTTKLEGIIGKREEKGKTTKHRGTEGKLALRDYTPVKKSPRRSPEKKNQRLLGQLEGEH